MPAYHAGRTLEATWRDLSHDIVDDVVVVDAASDDDTVAVARLLGLEVILHPQNMGYRAFARPLLDAMPWQRNSDDFVFDNEILAQAIVGGFRIGEISVPTRYFADASTINFPRSVRYGLGVVRTALLAGLARLGLYRHRLFRARD